MHIDAVFCCEFIRNINVTLYVDNLLYLYLVKHKKY